MLEKAAKIISEYVADGAKICVAVSGGKDSMCLLDFCLNFGGLKKENIGVVNVDHKIRGEASSRDSAFVKKYCAEKGIAFHGCSADVPALAESSGKSLETAAREERYAVFSRIASENGYKYVLTAHHALDNAETVLMHLFRGSGINGLVGMEVLSRGYILRPFLTTEKEDIDGYVEQRKIPFVTDETNSDSSYSRNFLRNDVLPLILSRWGGSVKAVNALSSEVKSLLPIIDTAVDSTLVKGGKNRAEMDLICFTDPALAPRYVVYALKIAGLKCDAERKHIDSVLNISRGRTGSAVDLPHGYRAEKSYGKIIIFKKEPVNEKSGSVPFKLGITKFYGQTVTAERAEEVRFGKTGELFLDAQKIPETACIRYRQDGDRFRPFGGGEKKLKEYFIDKKVPKERRDSIPLLCDGKRVLAVLNMEISDDVKLCGTSDAVKITVKD